MCLCATTECEAVTCVQDCHGEGQRGGLKLRREQEGCHYLMAAKSQRVHCCCSVSVWLVQSHSTSAALSASLGVGDEGVNVNAVRGRVFHIT